jgi:hypothetical protein
VTVGATAQPSRERAWWLRSLLVLQSPTPVFAALRETDEDDVNARAEPLTAIVFLAAVAAVLSTPTVGRLLDNAAIDGYVVPVLVIFTGGMHAVVGYFLLGYALYLGARPFGSLGSYRRARHVLGFAAAPLALSLFVLWPVRLALYGSDSFRSGGSDSPTGDHVFDALQLAFALWSLALLVVGVRAVHGWSWPRAAAGVALSAVTLAALVLVLSVL